MGDYIYPCPNGGRCRQIELGKAGINIVDVYGGTKKAEKFHHDGVPSHIFYNCCTGCKKPINFSEAVKVNWFLGNKVPDEPVDEDFLKVLDGI